MRLIFDAGTEKERVFECDSSYEHPMRNQFSATKTVPEGGEFPDLDEFKDNQDFETVALMDGETEIPLVGAYDWIFDVNISYFAAEHQYNATITLRKKYAEETT